VIVPCGEWAQLRAGRNEGLTTVKGIQEDLDAEIDKIVEEIYAARRKSRRRSEIRLQFRGDIR
jgi:hypothetical protein